MNKKKTMETEKIRQLIRQRLDIVCDDLSGIDEDINIHRYSDDYKEGFKNALGWLLDEINC